MRTILRGKLTLLFMALALVLAIPAIALADNLKNDLASTASNVVNYTAGSSAVSVGYWIEETASGGKPGCDAADGSAATVTLNVTKDGAPSSGVVNISPASQTFTACPASQTFTALRNGEHEVVFLLDRIRCGAWRLRS